MPIELQWIFVQIGQLAVGIALPVVLMRYVSRPCDWWWRATLITVVCWIGLVVFTCAVYQPIGIAHAEHRGVDNPYAGFDNNDTVPLIILGWLIPAISVGAGGLWRWSTQIQYDHAA